MRIIADFRIGKAIADAQSTDATLTQLGVVVGTPAVRQSQSVSRRRVRRGRHHRGDHQRALATHTWLRVAARTSCLACKGTKDDPRRIAERLGVRTVLEGEVCAGREVACA
jgi:TolB-like protein